MTPNTKEIKPYKLSPSTINLFLECKKCFYNQLVKKEKRPDSIFPSLPSGMDKILKEHFDKFMQKNKLPPEIKHLKNYKLFNKKETLDIWRSNFKGIQYKDKTSGILLRGAVDNILTKGKKLVVLDYKTRGYPLKEDTHEHYQTQMDIYNFLLRKNGYDTENYTYLLFYHPQRVLPNGNIIFNTDLIKIKTDPKRGEKVFKEAIKTLKSKQPPKSNKECSYCKYKEK